MADFAPTFKRYTVPKITQAPNAAGSLATIVFDPVPPGQVFLIERITVTSDSATATTAKIYEATQGYFTDADVVDFTLQGNNDIADQNSPIHIRTGYSCVIQWSNCSALANCRARIQYVIGEP